MIRWRQLGMIILIISFSSVQAETWQRTYRVKVEDISTYRPAVSSSPKVTPLPMKPVASRVAEVTVVWDGNDDRRQVSSFRKDYSTGMFNVVPTYINRDSVWSLIKPSRPSHPHTLTVERKDSLATVLGIKDQLLCTKGSLKASWQKTYLEVRHATYKKSSRYKLTIEGDAIALWPTSVEEDRPALTYTYDPIEEAIIITSTRDERRETWQIESTVETGTFIIDNVPSNTMVEDYRASVREKKVYRWSKHHKENSYQGQIADKRKFLGIVAVSVATVFGLLYLVSRRMSKTS